MTKKNKILGFDLDALISESIESLFESVGQDESVENMKEKLKQEEKAKSSAERKKKLKDDPSKKDAVSDEANDPVKNEKPVQIKHEKMPDINLKSIVTKLNSIRSGKSLKDSKTKNALKTYFQRLNGPERIALFAFLSGIDKILGDASKNVKTPHSDPFKIDMEQETPKTTKQQPKGTKSPSSSSDSETPIVVGERANVRSIKAKLWRN